MSSDRRWDSETDLLVVGAGAAGMTAALVGKLEGLDVILCEKSDVVGGTTATSADRYGSLEAARVARRASRPDRRGEKIPRRPVGEDAEDESLSAFLASGPAMLDYLERRTSVVLAPPPVHPDYHDLPGAALGGRALSAVAFDGRLLGADFERVRPPRREFMVLGGMMVGKNATFPPLLAPFLGHGATSGTPLQVCWLGIRAGSAALQARHAAHHGQRARRAAAP